MYVHTLYVRMYVPSHCVTVVCEEMGCFGILHMKSSSEKVTWLCGIVKFLGCGNSGPITPGLLEMSIQIHH